MDGVAEFAEAVPVGLCAAAPTTGSRPTDLTGRTVANISKHSLSAGVTQGFAIGDPSGQHLAKLGKLTQLEVFRCQGFGTEGVLALKGMNLSRLTLRDLPNVDDRAMEVFDELPKLKRLYLHELTSVGDSGLSHLVALKSLELLDIWTVPQMTDATVEVIAANADNVAQYKAGKDKAFNALVDRKSTRLNSSHRT